jgi:hypothetical protein
VNWYYSGAENPIGEPIYYDDSYHWALPDGDPSQTPLGDKVPFIVPPTTEKVAYFQHETIRSLWAEAGAALRQARRVFCIGYSLPEADMTMQFLLHGNQPRGAEFQLVDLRDLRNHYREYLPQCYSLSKRIGRFAVKNLVSSLLKRDEATEDE